MSDYNNLAEKEKNKVHITAIKVFQLKEHGIQSIIKVETDAGIYGIGEAGLPARIVQGYLDFMKDDLIGRDALAIEKNYAYMTRMRAQWHAHWVQNPTISGIDMALWDIAGKVFNRPVCELLTGKFREAIPLYVNTAGPEDWFDPVACRDWAQQMHEDPHGWKTIKFGFEKLLGKGLAADIYQPGWLSPMLKQTDLKIIRQGFENCREALGWDIDIIVHCHNEWDLVSALGIAEAVAPIKPLWLEDALPVLYSDSWKEFKKASPVRVMTGEKLEHPAEFLQFMMNGAVHAIHPDLVGRLTDEAAKAAQQVLTICIRALDYCPPVDLTFGDYLRALITADFDLVPDDPHGYRVAFVEAFRRRGIYPRDLRSLSVDALRWRQASEDRTENLLGEVIGKLREFADRFQYLESRREMFARTRAWQAKTHALLKKLFRESPPARRQEMSLALGLDLATGEEPFEVHALRVAGRAGPDGAARPQIILSLVQEKDLPEKSPWGDGEFSFSGGCTIIADQKSAKVNYYVSKNIGSRQRQERQRAFASRWTRGLSALYFRHTPLAGLGERFAMLHAGAEGS